MLDKMEPSDVFAFTFINPLGAGPNSRLIVDVQTVAMKPGGLWLGEVEVPFGSSIQTARAVTVFPIADRVVVRTSVPVSHSITNILVFSR